MAQGPSSAAVGAREACLVMPFIAGTGTYTAATVYEVKNEKDAEDGGGAGSPLHRGARKFLQMNKTTRLWALPVTETGGGGAPTPADVDITWTTNASAAGNTTLRVGDTDNTVSFVANDTPTTIAAAMVALINTRTFLPVTAANVAGVLTLTAKLDGVSQGDGTLDVIQTRVKIDAGVSTTVATAGALGQTTAGVDGTNTEATNLTTALAAITARRIYYLINSANDGASWDNLASHILTKSAPNPGLRSVGIVASGAAQAGVQTLAIADNYERLQVVHQEAGDHDGAELASAMGAIRALHENTDPTYNFAGFSGAGWRINPGYLDADWPTATEQNDAINDGVTPIASVPGASYVVMSVNTRSKTAVGGVDDFRGTETHRLSECDFFTDRLLTLWNQQFQGTKLASDSLLASGEVDPNQKQIKGVTKPSTVEKAIVDLLRDEEEAGNLQDVDASVESLRVVRSDTNASRIESAIDLHVIDHAHQFTARVAEVSPA
jgi:phage tail sheath gpL-like